MNDLRGSIISWTLKSIRILVICFYLNPSMPLITLSCFHWKFQTYLYYNYFHMLFVSFWMALHLKTQHSFEALLVVFSTLPSHVLILLLLLIQLVSSCMLLMMFIGMPLKGFYVISKVHILAYNYTIMILLHYLLIVMHIGLDVLILDDLLLGFVFFLVLI